MAHGSLAGPRATMARTRPVYARSIAARIRAMYEAFQEASISVPCVTEDLAMQQSIFRNSLLKDRQKFSVGAAGCGLTRRDCVVLETLLGVEIPAIMNTLAAIRAAGGAGAANRATNAAGVGGAGAGGGVGAAGGADSDDFGSMAGAACIAEALPSPNAIVTALRHEQDRVLAIRKWMQVPITLGRTTYIF